MPVTYLCDLTSPDTKQDRLDEYHDDISDLVDADVIGLAGQSPKIRRIVLSETTDVSDLEDWLGVDLLLEE